MQQKSVFTFLVLGAFVVVLAKGLTQDPRYLPSPLVGKKAPSFKAQKFDGLWFSLQDAQGKVVVLNFWASWCPSCWQEEEELEAAWNEFKNKDVVFIGVDMQDTREAALNYLKEHKKSYPQVQDPRGEISLDYGVYGVPETFFISRKGVITYKYVGPITEDVLAKEIQANLVE